MFSSARPASQGMGQDHEEPQSDDRSSNAGAGDHRMGCRLTSLAFDATVPFGPFDRTYIAGTEGAISSTGVDYHQQVLTLTNAEGTWTPKLEGRWFSDAFAGTMGELISSIVERRTCELNARDNLKSLALCFAAVASAETGNAIEPFSVLRLPN